MMTPLAIEQFKRDYERLSAGRREPVWLERLRDESFARFGELGWPTTREEAWKYTNVVPLSRIAFSAPHGGETDGSARALAAARASIAQLALPGATTITFVDGRFAADLSRCDDLPEGVRVRALRQAIEDEGEETALLTRSFGALRADGLAAFSALNAALFEDGAFVSVAPGVTLGRPLQLLFIDSGVHERTATQVRNVLAAGARSSALVFEDHVSLGSGERLINAVTRVALEQGARLELCRTQGISAEAYQLGALEIEQAEGSQLTSHYFSFGGALVRDEVRVRLAGEGAYCGLNGLFLVDGSRHVDNHTSIDHALPGCASEQLYKGILDDQAAGVFSGRIKVHKNAQKTDARQNSKNLLLSESATINAKPQLEIFADDVKCTHGATIGHLDEEALFYLRARGLDAAVARALLVQAFAGEIVERVSLVEVRERLGRTLRARLALDGAIEGGAR